MLGCMGLETKRAGLVETYVHTIAQCRRMRESDTERDAGEKDRQRERRGRQKRERERERERER
jgi:hypothetical protein